VTTSCIAVRWPGYRTTAWHHDVKEPDIRTWWGGLVDGMRDVSGQQYKRNRYYDPATGQFTQPDPIGIAGGLNSYGFAAGDPVTYSDPYGLCWELWRPECRDKAARVASRVTEPVFQATANFAAGFTENLVGVEEGTPPIDRDSRLYAAGRSLSDMVSGLGPEMNRAQMSGYTDITRGGSVPNRELDLTRTEFESNLATGGWARSVSRDGKVTIFQKDGARYTVRGDSRSTGTPTAEYFRPGSQSADLKLRLKP
jgi:RHS repeat-associated protein